MAYTGRNTDAAVPVMWNAKTTVSATLSIASTLVTVSPTFPAGCTGFTVCAADATSKLCWVAVNTGLNGTGLRIGGSGAPQSLSFAIPHGPTAAVPRINVWSASGVTTVNFIYYIG